MTILKRSSSILVTGAAAAAVLGLSAATFAAPTWSITPGKATSGSAPSATLTDTTTGDSVSCTSSTLKVTLKSGTGLAGAAAGSISSIALNGCTVDGATITISPKLPWKLNLVKYSKTTGVTTATISHIHASLAGPFGCHGIVDGTSGTADNGKVSVSYSNSTGVLTVSPTGGNLKAYSVSSCLGVVNTGDSVSLSAAYTLTPKQKITSP